MSRRTEKRKYGKYNKFDIIKEIEISVDEFEKAFEVMNETRNNYFM